MIDLTAADWVTIIVVVVWLSAIAAMWNADDSGTKPVEKCLELGARCSITGINVGCVKVEVRPPYRADDINVGDIIRLDTGMGPNTRHEVVRKRLDKNGAELTLSGGL